MTEFVTFSELLDGRITYRAHGPNGTGEAEGSVTEFRDIRERAKHIAGVVRWPRIEAANVMDDGQMLAVLLRESDGTVSAISISVEQLAD